MAKSSDLKGALALQELLQRTIHDASLPTRLVQYVRLPVLLMVLTSTLMRLPLQSA